MMGLDHAFVMSDHCDYIELLEFVKASNAEKIYTFHGFSQDFAYSLKKLGFDAEPVVKSNMVKKENESLLQHSLDTYF
jgi:putative mRNA 3-end processing factor